MSYSTYDTYSLIISGAVTASAAPMDIGTGLLHASTRFFIPHMAIAIIAGSGIGTPTFDFFTGYNGVGDIVNNGGVFSPANLNSSSGIDSYIAGVVGSSYITASQVVVRQMGNASTTGNVLVKLQISPLS